MRKSLQSRVISAHPAKYHGQERNESKIGLIVMHCTAGGTAKSTIEYQNTIGHTSYHYVIDRDGTIYRCVDVGVTAWHAGDSAFPADKTKSHQDTSVNPRSIGIAWSNMNDGENLTFKQIESALWLCGVFTERYDIPVEHVVGHSEVSPNRKSDPNPAIKMDDFRAKLAEYLTS